MNTDWMMTPEGLDDWLEIFGGYAAMYGSWWSDQYRDDRDHVDLGGEG